MLFGGGRRAERRFDRLPSSPRRDNARYHRRPAVGGLEFLKTPSWRQSPRFGLLWFVNAAATRTADSGCAVCRCRGRWISTSCPGERTIRSSSCHLYFIISDCFILACSGASAGLILPASSFLLCVIICANCAPSSSPTPTTRPQLSHWRDAKRLPIVPFWLGLLYPPTLPFNFLSVSGCLIRDK